MKKIFSLFAAVLFAFAVNAAETNVEPGTGGPLRKAVAAATAGDVLILTDGVYEEPEVVQLDKSLTIKAADGKQPVIAQQYYMKLLSSAQVTFIGIKFDGSLYNDGQGANDHFIRPYDNSANKTLTMIDCEVCNFKSYVLYPQRADRCMKSLVLQDCYFHGNARSAVYVETGSSNPCPLAELIIENSTFAGTGASYRAIDVKNGGDVVADAKITIDHSTFYNYASVRSSNSTDVAISNSIFAFPTEGSTLATELPAGATINNCLTFNMTHAEGPTVTNPVTGDPLFKDVANADYTLGEGSPALTAATDGGAIGDPRWVAAAEEPELTTIYCKMEHEWWTKDGAAVGIYTWDAEGVKKAEWPGERMTLVEGEDNVWSFDLDLNTYKMCIFTRVNASGDIADWGAKTKDLTIPTDGKNLFTIAAPEVWGDPGCEGAWSVYGEEPEPVNPIAETYFATGEGWTPDAESKAEWDAENEKIVVTIAQDKIKQWQAQVKIQGIPSEKGKFYHVGLKMNSATNVKGITLKWEDNNGYIFEDQKIALEAGVEFVFDEPQLLARGEQNGNGILVLDFGQAKAGDVIEISDIVIEEVDAPEITLEDGYYVIGLNGWSIYDLTAADKFVANAEAEGEWLLADVELVQGQEFKVVEVAEKAIKTWFGAKNDGNYVVTTDVAGVKTIYFNPVKQDAWEGHIYVQLNEAEPTVYCNLATGHLGDANFGDPSGRILLTIKRTAENSLIVSIRNNNENGNTQTGLNFMWVNATGATNNNATYGSHEADNAEEISVEVKFDAAQDSYHFNNIHWAYAGWSGEWAIDGLDVLASELCEDGEVTFIETNIVAPKAVKMIENGQLIIIRDGIRYNAQGQQF